MESGIIKSNKSKGYFITSPKISNQEEKENQREPFSMADCKNMYNNALLLERFIDKFGINPNTRKNQKIIAELLNFGKIAA